jgi:hypothetical protein
LEGFSYVLQIDMHFICTPMWTKFYSCKKWVLQLPYWKDLDVHHSIDVMHVEKNVYESLLGTLLNMDGETMDHGHARADLKKL